MNKGVEVKQGPGRREALMMINDIQKECMFMAKARQKGLGEGELKGKLVNVGEKY